MSRIGKQPVQIPQKVKISLSDGQVNVEGPKGKLHEPMVPGIQITVEGDTLKVIRKSDEQKIVSLHGMMRAKINNMIKGVTTGFEKVLDINGVGYKALLKGKDLELSLGYSHSILVKAPEGIRFEVEGAVHIKVSGPDKCLVGQVSSNIRDFKPPEPYKGKGVRYHNEYVRRKAGKAAVATAA